MTREGDERGAKSYEREKAWALYKLFNTLRLEQSRTVLRHETLDTGLKRIARYCSILYLFYVAGSWCEHADERLSC
jgi:hypothetical protein